MSGDTAIEINVSELGTMLEGETLFIALSEKDLDLVNDQSGDCDRAVIVMRDRILLAEHREHGRNGRILFRIIPSFDEKIYNLRVQPPNGSALTFVSMRSALDGSIKAVKYRFADRYVFLFASEFNLIVTKSVFDMFEEDDTPIPEWDDSVLIDRYLGQSAGDHNTLQTELSAVCFGNQEKEGADQNGTE